MSRWNRWWRERRVGAASAAPADCGGRVQGAIIGQRRYYLPENPGVGLLFQGIAIQHRIAGAARRARIPCVTDQAPPGCGSWSRRPPGGAANHGGVYVESTRSQIERQDSAVGQGSWAWAWASAGRAGRHQRQGSAGRRLPVRGHGRDLPERGRRGRGLRGRRCSRICSSPPSCGTTSTVTTTPTRRWTRACASWAWPMSTCDPLAGGRQRQVPGSLARDDRDEAGRPRALDRRVELHRGQPEPVDRFRRDAGGEPDRAASRIAQRELRAFHERHGIATESGARWPRARRYRKR